MSNYFDEFGERSASDWVESQPKLNHECETKCDTDACSATLQRDRFELLSAYLDGEVTAAERRQVEAWLATDAKTQCLYSRLLSLRQGLQMLPITSSEQTVDQLVASVTAQVERRPRRLLWGGMAAAAVVVGALLGSMIGRESYAPSVAENFSAPASQVEEVPTDGLMIALNRPPIEIPQSAIASPENLKKPAATTVR
jgi:anti-sigma factor RsiW